MKKEKGFTLIELLVVIAIIGILAGILFIAINPKVQTDKANDAKIYSSVDGMRLVLANYFTENNESFENANLNNKVIEIKNQYPFIVIESSDNKWAVKNKLTSGKYFCRDSSGNVSEKLVQDISDYKCD